MLSIGYHGAIGGDHDFGCDEDTKTNVRALVRLPQTHHVRSIRGTGQCVQRNDSATAFSMLEEETPLIQLSRSIPAADEAPTSPPLDEESASIQTADPVLDGSGLFLGTVAD